MNFIKDNALRQVKVANKDALPVQAYWGTMYLIKNNSVIEFYSYYCNDDRDLLHSRPYVEPQYKCSINLKHIDYNDVKDVHSAFTDDEMESHALDKTLDFVMVLIRTGFDCYIK